MLLTVVFVEAAIALYVLYMADRCSLFVSRGLGTLNGRFISPAADALRIAYHAVSQAATRYLQVAAPQSVPEHYWRIESIEDGGGHFHWHLAFEPSLLSIHDGVPLLGPQVDPVRFDPATLPALVSAAFIVCGLLGFALRKRSSGSKEKANTPLLPLTIAHNTVYDFSTTLDLGLATKDTDLYTPWWKSPRLYYPPGFATTFEIEAGDVAFRVDSGDNSLISDMGNVLSGLDFFDLRDENRKEKDGAGTAVDLENGLGYTPIMSPASAGISETTAVSRNVSDTFSVETSCPSLGEDDRTTCTREEVKEEKSEIVPKTHKREKKSRMKTKLKKESALNSVTSPTSMDIGKGGIVGVTNLNTTTTITADETIAIPRRSFTPTSTSFESSSETSVYKSAMEQAFSPAKEFLRELDTHTSRTRVGKKVSPDEPLADKGRSRKPERIPNTHTQPTTSSIITLSLPKAPSIARSKVHAFTYGKSTHAAETPLHTPQEVALAVRIPQDREAREKVDPLASRPRGAASDSGIAPERTREIKGSGARSLEFRNGRGRAVRLIGNSGKGAKLDSDGCGCVEKDAVVVGAPVARALALEVTPSLCADKDTDPSANLQVPAATTPSTLPVLTGARANRYRPAKRLLTTPASGGMDTRAKTAKDRALDAVYTSIIASMGSATYLRDRLAEPRSLPPNALPARPPLQHADDQWNWEAIWALRKTAVSLGVSDAGATVESSADELESRVVDAALPVDCALDSAVADLVVSSVAATVSTGPDGTTGVGKAGLSDVGDFVQYELRTTATGVSDQIEETNVSPIANDLRPWSVPESPEADGWTPALKDGAAPSAEGLQLLPCDVPNVNHDHGSASSDLGPQSAVAVASKTSLSTTPKLISGPSLERHITCANTPDIGDRDPSLPPSSLRRSVVPREHSPIDVRKTCPPVTIDNRTDEDIGSDSDDEAPRSSDFFQFEECDTALPEDDRELFESDDDRQDPVYEEAEPVLRRNSFLKRDLPLVSTAGVEEDLSLSVPLLGGGDDPLEHPPADMRKSSLAMTVDNGPGEESGSDDEAGASPRYSGFFQFEESGIALPDDDRELFEPDNDWQGQTHELGGDSTPNLQLGPAVAGMSRTGLAVKPDLRRNSFVERDYPLVGTTAKIREVDLSLSIPPFCGGDVLQEDPPTDIGKTGPVVTANDEGEEESDYDSDDEVRVSVPFSSFFRFEESGIELPEDDRELFELDDDWKCEEASYSASHSVLRPAIAGASRTASGFGNSFSLGRDTPPVSTANIDEEDLSLSVSPPGGDDGLREAIDMRKAGGVVAAAGGTGEGSGPESDGEAGDSLSFSGFFRFEESGIALPEDDRELFGPDDDGQDQIYEDVADPASSSQLGHVIAEVPMTDLAITSGFRNSPSSGRNLSAVGAAESKDKVLSPSLHEGDGVQEHAPEKVVEICSSVGDVDSGDCAEEDADSDDAGAYLPSSSFFRFEESGIALPEDDQELFEPDNSWLAPVSSVTKSRPSAEHSSDDKTKPQDVDSMSVQDETSGCTSEEIQVELQDGQEEGYEETAHRTKAADNSKAILGDDFCSVFSNDADLALVPRNIEGMQVSDSVIDVSLALNFLPMEALIDTTLSGLHSVSGTFEHNYDDSVVVGAASREIQGLPGSLVAMDSVASKAYVNTSTSMLVLGQDYCCQQEANGEPQESVRLLVDLGTSVSGAELKGLACVSATTCVSASTSTSVLGWDGPAGTPVYLNASTSTLAVSEMKPLDMSTSSSGVILNELGVTTEQPDDAGASLKASTSELAAEEDNFCKATCNTEVRLEASDPELASRQEEGLEDSESAPKEGLITSTLSGTPSVAVVGKEGLLAARSTVGDSPTLGSDSRDSSPYRREYDFSNALCTPTLVVDDSPCFDYLAKGKRKAFDAVSATPTPAALPTTAASRKAAGPRVSDLIACFQRPVQTSTPAPRRAPASPYLPRTPSPLSSAPLCPVDLLQPQDNEAASPSPRALSPLLVPRCIVKVNGELRRTNLRAGLTDEIGERRAEGGSAKDKFSKEMVALLKRHNEKTIVNSS